jgi:ABC-type glycerol-3-phosphate transport system substrate-binding protein
MKKLLLVLVVFSSLAYAGEDCSKAAQKVVDKLASHNKTSVSINYSSDQAEKAKTCEAAIKAKNSAITVNLNQVSGTGVFKFAK